MDSHLFFVAFLLAEATGFAHPLQGRTPQQSPDAQGALTLGVRAKRTLPPTATHAWTLDLRADEYVVARVLQQGVDVVVRVISPAGALVREFDSPTGISGMETAVWITDTAGPWQVHIASLGSAAAGGYEVLLEVARDAGADDRERLQAADSARVLVKASQLAFKDGTAASLERALALRTQSVERFRRADDRPSSGPLLYLMGYIHQTMGRPDTAIVYFQQALAIAREVGDRRGEGMTLLQIGLVYQRWSRPDTALAYYREALAIEREVGDRRLEGFTLTYIGVQLRALGRSDSALAAYRQALAVVRELGDAEGERTNLRNIGIVYSNTGRHDSALAYYDQVLAITPKAGDRHEEALTLVSIGVANSHLGRPDSALAVYRQALAILRAGRDSIQLGIVLSHIGAEQAALDQPDSAVSYYQHALTIQRATADRSDEGVTLSRLGNLHRRQSRPDSALVYFRQALAIQRQIGYRAGEAAALTAIGFLFLHQVPSQPDSALEPLRLSLKIDRDIGDPIGERTDLRLLGELFHVGMSPPNLPAAVAYYDSAVAVASAEAAHVRGDPDRLSFAEMSVGAFEMWTSAWLARASEVGFERAALAGLAASERGRAQALLVLMRGNSAEIAAGSDLIEEGRRLLERASASGTGILSYLVTLDTLIIWFGAPGSEVTVVQRPVARDSLAQLVGSFRAALGVAGAAGGALALRGGQPIEPGSARGALSGGIQARQASRRSVDSIADALGKLLLPANLDQRLGPAREIVIVPHGSLGLVPFGALPSDSVGTPLGSRYALRYTPSLAALAEAEARPALPTTATRIITLRKALVVGDPVMPTTASWGEAFELRPLHAAGVEGRWVAARLKARSLTGPQATEAEVRDRLPAAPLVHLATHGYAYASDTRARRSFVALAPTSTQDGFLTVGELLDDPQLTLSAELVVLSACQTGLGDLKQAEGTVGLQRALLARGARSALVSLWSVSDAATDLLMKRFYTHWLDDADHPSKAEALRRAQEDVRARRQFRQPKYWAAFQLVGAR